MCTHALEYNEDGYYSIKDGKYIKIKLDFTFECRYINNRQTGITTIPNDIIPSLKNTQDITIPNDINPSLKNRQDILNNLDSIYVAIRAELQTLNKKLIEVLEKLTIDDNNKLINVLEQLTIEDNKTLIEVLEQLTIEDNKKLIKVLEQLTIGDNNKLITVLITVLALLTIEPNVDIICDLISNKNEEMCTITNLLDNLTVPNKSNEIMNKIKTVYEKYKEYEARQPSEPTI